MAVYPMVFTTLITLLTLKSASAILKESAPTIPEISQDFTCQTEEVDANGDVVLMQKLVWSASQRRSLMSAKGSLVRGFMEQIKRCDLLPKDGWFTNAGGPGNPSEWACTNTTLPPNAETPKHCIYGNFWTIHNESEPKYMGQEPIKGVECDRWDYETTNPSTGERQQMAFWARPLPSSSPLDGERGDPIPTPCATSQLGAWTLYIYDFKAQDPPLDQFYPTANYSCPASSLPYGQEGPRTLGFSLNIPTTRWW